MVTPAPGRDEAAFQQDLRVCQRHAETGSGYDDSETHAAPPPSAPSAGAGLATEDAAFVQCMAARGDQVTPAPSAYAAAYPVDPYPAYDGFPFLAGGLLGGYLFVGGEHHGHNHRAFGNHGWYHGGFPHAGPHGGRGGGHR